MPSPRRFLQIALLASVAALPHASVQAQAAASAYQYAVPAGWSRSLEGDTELLTPTSEPAGSAQVLLFAPKAASGDFGQQFEGERAALEQFWGLRAPAPVAPQRGQSARGPYGAYFASYDSDAGPRYMSFLAQTQNQQFVLLVFVAASDDAFNRLAPAATELFRALELSGR